MISDELAERLRSYYNGKLCSIITQPFALSQVDAKAFHTWFTLRIDDIDQEAILGTDLNRGTKHVFFFGPAIIGIAEEQVIPPDHPDYERMRKKIEETNREAQEQIRNQSMPTKPEASHTLKQLPILPAQTSAIDKISRQAADLKKKWATSATQQGAPSNEPRPSL
jgi:hypothetical protein